MNWHKILEYDVTFVWYKSTVWSELHLLQTWGMCMCASKHITKHKIAWATIFSVNNKASSLGLTACEYASKSNEEIFLYFAQVCIFANEYILNNFWDRSITMHVYCTCTALTIVTANCVQRALPVHANHA